MALIYQTPETFLAWLDRKDAPPTVELLDWCYDGFAQGREADPTHRQLFNALPPEGGTGTPKHRLAHLIAAALVAHPDLAFDHPGFRHAPDKLLQELLNLAAHLDSPDVLQQPLWAVRQAFLERGLAAWPRTRRALLRALAGNQRHHPELLDVWLAMTEGRPDPVLGGTPEIGFEALALMSGQDDPECPDRKAMSKALVNLARHYEPDKQHRGQRFREQVLWLRDLRGALRPDYFLRSASLADWPDWAILSLSDLLTLHYGLIPQSQYHRSYVVGPKWAVAAMCITCDVRLIQSQNGDTLHEVHYSGESGRDTQIKSKLDMFASTFMDPVIRLGTQKAAGSENEILGLRIQAVEEICQSLPNNHSSRATVVQKVRQEGCAYYHISAAVLARFGYVGIYVKP
jgi:hypothetical protein